MTKGVRNGTGAWECDGDFRIASAGVQIEEQELDKVPEGREGESGWDPQHLGGLWCSGDRDSGAQDGRRPGDVGEKPKRAQ